ncbi:hypothetical protein [Vibrio fluvialis]|uniref:hypothetical protein n=1 Tax=Vibrio fluvialis TaxID=676 RepID=UPI0028F71286|nr:hypothetical protein [Vibrio fluvialis]
MAIDAGTVYYTVDADTQKAIDSAAEMKGSLEQMQTAMAKTDVQTRQYTKALNEAGNSISKAGVVLDQFGNVNAEATAKMQKLMAMTDSLNQRHIQLSKTATGVRTGLAGMGRGAGQAGIQFQQLIGQIQGGQSVMLALSQQSADLGFVLGAPLLGAVVGIGASLAGMLIPNLFKTTDALEDVEKATERVKAAITLSSEGITGYSEQMKVLAGLSQSLARVELVGLIAEQANAMKVARDSIKETSEDIIGLYGVTNRSVEKLFGSMSEQGMETAIELRKSLNELSVDINTDSIERVTQALSKAEDQGLLTTESGRSLNSLVINLIGQYRLGEITIKQFNEQLEKSEITFDDVGKSANKYTSLLNSLTVKTHELRSAQLEQQKAITLQEEGYKKLSPEKQKAIADAFDAVIANEKEAESEKALAKAKREKAAAEREAQRARKAAIADDQASADIMISLKADSDKNKNLLGQLDPMQGEQQRFQLQLDNLKSLNDAKLLEDQRYLDLKAQAETQHEQNMQALREQNFKAQSKNNELLMNSLDALGNAGTNAISGLLSGTTNATQAIQSLANAVLNEAVGALVQMGMQYVKNQIIGDTAAAASVATATATGAAISAAYAPAATAASIATQGGAVGSATAAMSAVVPAMNAMLMGGRMYGGAVQANGMYRINENGAPEVFNAANGQQYMLPNTRGEVVSNKDASGGGTTMINITVNADGSISGNGGAEMQQLGKEISKLVDARINQAQVNSMKQGGALWLYLQKGGK